MKKVIILLLVAVFLFGCSNPNNETGNKPITPVVKQPGKFSATVLSDAMGGNARGISLGSYTISNSKSIFFILRNVGDFAITGIKLTAGKLNNGGTFEPITDNGITTSPSAITVLETSGNASVETVIEVDINHGNVVGLISQQYIQKADFKGTTIRITGKTKNESGAALDVSLDVDIETFIKVASFEVVYSLDNGATYKKAEYWQDMKFKIPNSGKNHIKILNTGNVPLRYKAVKAEDVEWGGAASWENFVEWINVAAGDYSNLLIINPTNIVAFVVDTFGVAFDNDGMEYYVFRAGTSIVVNGFVPSDNVMFILID